MREASGSSACRIKALFHYRTLHDWRLKNWLNWAWLGQSRLPRRGRWACAQSLSSQPGPNERLSRQCLSDFHSDVTFTLLLPLSCGCQTLAPACSGNAQASFEAQPCGLLVSILRNQPRSGKWAIIGHV